MINRLKNTSLFYAPYLILFGLAIVFYFYQSHGDFVIWLNKLHNPIWDFFFKYWTLTGSVFFFGGTCILLIFVKRRFGFILALVGSSVLLTSLFFKFIMFPDVPRPIIYFEPGILKLVSGVEVLSMNSFPSGHAMAAFALGSYLALMFQNNNYSAILLIGACLTALSRVYLSQHFLIDIMAGSLIGVIMATGLYFIFEKYLNKESTGSISTPDEDLEAMDLND
jgi:membrane-associated phospholipid phosphatase